MTLPVAIIDYGMSNLFSVAHACRRVGLTPVTTADPHQIVSAAGAILPGVGAFGEAMAELRRLDLVAAIGDFVATGKPFLGICLGMQLLFDESEEFGACGGLHCIPGRVKKFPRSHANHDRLRVPFIGWNEIYPSPEGLPWSNTILDAVRERECMYFIHSFYVEPAVTADVLSLTSFHSFEYCSGIRRGAVTAVQFHPEKSAQAGLKIYDNWAETVRRTRDGTAS